MIGQRKPAVAGNGTLDGVVLRGTVVVLAGLGVAAAGGYFLVAPYNPGFVEHPAVAGAHAALGGCYLLLAPLQFVAQIRARALGYHRAAGRALVAVGLVVGATGLFLGLVVPFAGSHERVVIGVFGTLFLMSTVLGAVRVGQGRIAEHREWMLRAFAVALSVATMRLLLALSLAVFPTASDAAVALLSVGAFAVSFVLHAAVAEWWIRRTRPVSGGSPGASDAAVATAS